MLTLPLLKLGWKGVSSHWDFPWKENAIGWPDLLIIIYITRGCNWTARLCLSNPCLEGLTDINGQKLGSREHSCPHFPGRELRPSEGEGCAQAHPEIVCRGWKRTENWFQFRRADCQRVLPRPKLWEWASYITRDTSLCRADAEPYRTEAQLKKKKTGRQWVVFSENRAVSFSSPPPVMLCCSALEAHPWCCYSNDTSFPRPWKAGLRNPCWVKEMLPLTVRARRAAVNSEQCLFSQQIA